VTDLKFCILTLQVRFCEKGVDDFNKVGVEAKRNELLD
jgi:hypothetical protein